MTEHHFSDEVAKLYGVNEAILLNYLQSSIQNSITENKNFINGCYWSCNTYSSLMNVFPYFTKRQLERIIESCIKQGLLIKGHFCENRKDRANWYSITNALND